MNERNFQSEKPLIEYFHDFLDWLEIEKGLSSKTQENYARFLSKFFNWLKKENLEQLKPKELTLDHITKYRLFLARQYSKKDGEGLKKTTQNYYLIGLRSFLNFLAERNIESLAPNKVKLAREKKDKEVKFLTLKEIEKLFSVINLNTFEGIRDRAILETLFSTGMRISELIALNRDQFEITPKTKELEISIVGKGGKRRPVYFSKRAIFWIRKYLEKRKDKEKALFVSFKNKARSPKRISARAIQKAIKKYSLLAGLPLKVTPHVLRHSFATDLLSQGVDLRIVQEFLGHKTILATQIYTHITSKKLKEIHKKFHSGKRLKV